MTSGYYVTISEPKNLMETPKNFESEKIFKFHDIFDNNDFYCLVKITVIEKISGGKPIYDISYSYEYSDNERALRANPFFYSKNIEDSDKEGVIVFKNEMTHKMIEFLLMDPDELSKKSSMYWVQYKIKIMESLANFWD